MSILTQIASGIAIPAAAIQPKPQTMQDVYDDAVKAGKDDEAKAIKRLADFFAKPLSDLQASVERFDEIFPLVKTEQQVPGGTRTSGAIARTTTGGATRCADASSIPSGRWRKKRNAERARMAGCRCST